MNRVNHAFLKYFSCFGIDDEEMLEEGFQYADLCEDDVVENASAGYAFYRLGKNQFIT